MTGWGQVGVGGYLARRLSMPALSLHSIHRPTDCSRLSPDLHTYVVVCVCTNWIKKKFFFERESSGFVAWWQALVRNTQVVDSYASCAQDLSERQGLWRLLQGGAQDSARGVLIKINTYFCFSRWDPSCEPSPVLVCKKTKQNKTKKPLRSKMQIICIYLCMNVSLMMRCFMN